MPDDSSVRLSPKSQPFLAAAAGFADGKDTPRAFLERCVEVIDAQEKDIGVFVSLNLDGARAAADAATERWKAGKTLSAIDGMPVGIKDIMETADMPTEQGSPLFAGARTGRDAAAVVALREAGAVVIGKTVTTEFAATEPRGTRNPWDLSRTPGGSSSGSAAGVAAGMFPAGLGTQVIGSILRPASYCGCFGYKPSIGGINRGGSFDGFSQSCSGVLAATLDETWRVAREISARAGGDPGYPGVSGPMDLPEASKPARVAVLRTAGWDLADDAAKAAFEAACGALRDAGVEVVGPEDDDKVEAADTAIVDAQPLSLKINAWESRWPLNTYARDMDRSGLSDGMLDRLAEGEAMTLEQYQRLIGDRRRIRDIHARLAEEFDAVITLAATGAAPVGISSTGNPVFAVPGSLLGVPALSLPVMAVDGLPLGLQVMGYMDRDADLFAVAGALAGILADA